MGTHSRSIHQMDEVVGVQHGAAEVEGGVEVVMSDHRQLRQLLLKHKWRSPPLPPNRLSLCPWLRPFLYQRNPHLLSHLQHHSPNEYRTPFRKGPNHRLYVNLVPNVPIHNVAFRTRHLWLQPRVEWC